MGDYRSETTPVQIRKGEVQAAIEALETRPFVERIGPDGDACPIAIVPKGYEVQSLKGVLDEYLERPERKRGAPVFTTIDSLAAYVNRFKRPETLIYVDDTSRSNPAIVAVLNEHDAEDARLRGVLEPLPAQEGQVALDSADVPDSLPGFRDWRAQYRFPLTPEWQAWYGIADKEISQRTLAEFLEEHAHEVCDPSDPGESANRLAETLGLTLAGPAKLLSLSRSLNITAEQKLVSHQNLSSGEARFSFEETHKDGDSGAPISMPGAFAIAVPVFRGGARYRIAVRLRYRMKDQKAVFTLKPHRLDLILEDAIEGAAEQLRRATAVPVLRGAP